MCFKFVLVSTKLVDHKKSSPLRTCMHMYPASVWPGCCFWAWCKILLYKLGNFTKRSLANA